MITILFFLFTLLSACTVPTPWKCESISTEDPIFDSARLTYVTSSPLQFELIRLGQEIEGFLNLAKHKFSSRKETLTATLQIGEEKIEEELPLLEGNMRLRFSPKLTKQLITALQEGEEVLILVDGFEERIDPTRFFKEYKKLQAHETFLNHILFKGLF